MYPESTTPPLQRLSASLTLLTKALMQERCIRRLCSAHSCSAYGGILWNRCQRIVTVVHQRLFASSLPERSLVEDSIGAQVVREAASRPSSPRKGRGACSGGSRASSPAQQRRAIVFGSRAPSPTRGKPQIARYPILVCAVLLAP